MDQTLQNSQPTTQQLSWHSINIRVFAMPTKRLVFGLGMAIGFVSLMVGCQSQQLWNESQSFLPVPPKVLDQETLQSVRFQSPGGGSGSRGGGPGPESFLPPPEAVESDIVPDFEQLADLDGGVQPEIIKEVIITGNESMPTHHLSRNIRTRQGRYFDPDKLQQDVNMLWRMPEIQKVKGPFLDRQPDGIVVRMEVVERNRISTIKFIGNRGISDRSLSKKTGLEDGSPLDVHEIRMAKTKIEELYREKGYPRTQVEILDDPENSNGEVVFLIHEDEQQRIWKVAFEGNTIATDARLRTVVQSKPGILKVFGGLAKKNEIEQDVDRVTSYYRGLGFFNAQVGREVSESNDGRWLTVRYIINEGPRYQIRNVRFIGNQAFQETELASLLQMHPEKEMPGFNTALLNEDLTQVRDLYGSQGYVFADVQVENRFLEEPGMVDLVYKIKEGKQYRVGQINVHYEGGNSITKSSVVRNRVRLRPGDVIDMRKVRQSERTLGGSQIFAAGQSGAAPSITVKPRELKNIEAMADLDGLPSGPRAGSRTANSSGSGSRSSGGSNYR